MKQGFRTMLKECEVCGRDFPVTQSVLLAGHGRSCSMKCRDKLPGIQHDRRGPRNPNWKGGPQTPSGLSVEAYRNRHPERIAANHAVYLAIRRGDLVPQPCEFCGEDRVDAHHDDYTKPFAIRWLCHAHHMAIHARNRQRFAVSTQGVSA